MSADEAVDGDEPEPSSPLAALDVIGVQDVEIADGFAHIEVFTLHGLLTILWHGPRDADAAALMFGGAMGGLLGPADGLYHDLGVELARHGIGTLRIGYRRPNDLERCTLDVVAAADLAARAGARRFVTVGHSFGGAIAVRAGIMLGEHAAGVVTLATQSAGCEMAEALGDTPLLLFHGDRDELLPAFASEVVHSLAGGQGELVVLPNTGHLLTQAGDILRERLLEWITARLTEPGDDR
jgi:pimeloyl-ACP methyl ester carboxylesterase